MHAKYDNEHKIRTNEFEDNITDGLFVLKNYDVNGENQGQRMFYIKIVDRTINKYKRVQSEKITIDNITIKPLAKSEDNKMQYMPNADLIMNSSEKLISIPIINDYIFTGADIEQCTCKRQMNYTVDDITYRQGI